MKISSIAFSLISLVGFASTGLAAEDALTLKDGTVLKGEFTLKDGKVLKGKVLRMQGEAYVIEYQVTPSIKDLKVVPKKDVVKITTEKLDENDFVAVAKLVPTPDALTADDYKQRLLAVKTFISKYPTSAKRKDANAILKTLTDESAVLDAGGKKLQGMMVTGADFRANAFDLDARVIAAKIREAVKNSQWIVALRAFADLDKEYQTTVCYREVLPLVLKAMQTLRAQAAGSLAAYDARMEKQAADLEKMASGDRINSTRELAAEAARLEARYQAEKASQQLWVTPNASHKQSLEDISSFAEAEIQRLTTSQRDPSVTADGGKVFRDTWKAIYGNADAEALEKAMSEAESAGLPERYIKILQEAAKASGAKPSEEK